MKKLIITLLLGIVSILVTFGQDRGTTVGQGRATVKPDITRLRVINDSSANGIAGVVLEIGDDTLRIFAEDDSLYIFGTSTVNFPQGLRLGDSDSTKNGVIRWTGTDYEGFINSQWVSFTDSTLTLSDSLLWYLVNPTQVVNRNARYVAVNSLGLNDSIVYGTLPITTAPHAPEPAFMVIGFRDDNGSYNLGVGSYVAKIYCDDTSRHPIGMQIIFTDTSGNYGYQYVATPEFTLEAITDSNDVEYQYAATATAIDRRVTWISGESFYREFIRNEGGSSGTVAEWVMRDTFYDATLGSIIEPSATIGIAASGAPGVSVTVGDGVTGHYPLIDSINKTGFFVNMPIKSDGTTMFQARGTAIEIDLDYVSSDSLLKYQSGFNGDVSNTGGGFNQDVWVGDITLANDNGVVDNAIHWESRISTMDTTLNAFGLITDIELNSDTALVGKSWCTRLDLTRGAGATTGGKFRAIYGHDIKIATEKADTLFFISNFSSPIINPDSVEQYYSWRMTDPNMHWHNFGHGHFGNALSAAGSLQQWRLEVNADASGGTASPLGIFKSTKALFSQGTTWLHGSTDTSSYVHVESGEIQIESDSLIIEGWIIKGDQILKAGNTGQINASRAGDLDLRAGQGILALNDTIVSLTSGDILDIESVDSVSIRAQTSIDISESKHIRLTPDSSVHINTTLGALILPRLTTAERDAISTPIDGMIIYNTTTNQGEMRENGSWVDL